MVIKLTVLGCNVRNEKTHFKLRENTTRLTIVGGEVVAHLIFYWYGSVHDKMNRGLNK